MAQPRAEKVESKEPARRRHWRGFVNFLIMILVALAVRAFVAEPFRIPTGSMEPTLLGAEGWGDRIFAKKFSYSALMGLVETGQPQRWDVVLFYGPHRDARGYRTGKRVRFIKRLIGLPGEKLEICDGDIFIDGQLARKPPHVQETLWHPLYQLDLSSAPEKRHWPWALQTANEADWQFEAGQLLARVRNHTVIRYTGRLTNLYLRPVYRAFECPGCGKHLYGDIDTAHTWLYCASCGSELDLLASGVLRGRERYPQSPDDESSMNDLRLDARFAPARNAAVTLTIVSRGREFSARYSASNEQLTLGIEETNEALGALTPMPSGEIELSLRFYDARVQVFAQRLLLAERDVEPFRPERGSTLAEPIVRIRVAFDDVAFKSLAVFRDIYYTQLIHESGGGAMHPGPAGLVYVLGDNEYWVMGDNSPSSSDSRYWGPIGREDLIGKAWFIFWPPHRLRFIQ